MSTVLAVKDVATILGITAERVRRLDGRLRPTRDERGRRRYTVDRVQAVILERYNAGAGR